MITCIHVQLFLSTSLTCSSSSLKTTATPYVSSIPSSIEGRRKEGREREGGGKKERGREERKRVRKDGKEGQRKDLGRN